MLVQDFFFFLGGGVGGSWVWGVGFTLLFGPILTHLSWRQNLHRNNSCELGMHFKKIGFSVKFF